MKLFASFLLCIAIMLGVVFAQVPGRQGTEIRTGGGGTGSGGVTGQYVFNGPFTVQNVTNVFLSAVLSNQVMTGISAGATNASAYIASLNGLGTNTTIRQSIGTTVPLTISPLIGAVTNRFSILDTNGNAVVFVMTNNIFVASNGQFRGILEVTSTASAAGFFDTDFTGDRVIVSEGTPTGELIESPTIEVLELGRLDGLTTDLAAKNNNVNLTTNITGAGTVTVSSNNTGGWTITGTGGTATTTNLAAFSFAMTPLISRTTNNWADGTNSFYTNVFHSVAGGLTNVYVTNMMEGQTIEMWLFPSNGMTVGFPQFAATDHLDGSVITPATNIWSRVKVTRRGTSTNILVTTKTFEINWGNIVASTNFVTGVITLTAGGSPAGSTYQVQYYSNGTFDADAPFYYVAPSNHLVISNGSFGVSIIQPQLILAAGTDGGGPRHFKFIVEDGTNRIVSQNSASHALLIEQGPIGTYRFDTNSLTPPQNGATFLGTGPIRWRSMFGWTNDTTNLYVRGGTIGAGRVLTDASGTGEATWQPVSSSGVTRNDINGGTTATNLVIDSNKNFVLTNSLSVDVTYALSNAADGVEATVYLLGQTNAANNHTVSFTAAQGCVINWQGSGTNAPASFTLFSNATATVYFKVTTNQLGTNIVATWITDSYWPQPNAPLVAAAGASSSNYLAGGLMYYDYANSPYTNHSSAGLNYTNLALWMSPSFVLTNIGDSVRGVWRGVFRGANNGTNQLIIGYGTVTNIADTGQITNRAGVAWEYICEITATGPTNQSIFSQFQLSGPTTLQSGMTNSQTRAVSGIITNGVTNIFRLQARGFGAGAITNDFFKVFYQPGIR